MPFDRKKLKHLMKSRGITQVTLAQATGKETRTVSRWLSGNNVPKERDILRIASLLQCEPVEFYKNFVEAPNEGIALHATVSTASYNAFELMRLRYNVSQRDIIEIAPVLFSIVAAHALKVPQRDVSALSKALECGLYASIAGNAEEETGFQLDQKAADLAKCFGIKADPFTATPRNLFYHALVRLSRDVKGVVDASQMYEPEAGVALKVSGFNVDPKLLSYLTDGDEEKISAFTNGQLRMPDRKTREEFDLAEFSKYVQRQLNADHAGLEVQREKSLMRLKAWQEAYAAEHPQLEEEYRLLAEVYYETEGYMPQDMDGKERNDFYADPFNAKRYLKHDVSIYGLGLRRIFKELQQPEERREVERVRRLEELELQREKSKRRFIVGAD